MKKWILLVVFCLVLSGCSLLPDASDDNGENSTPTTTTTTDSSGFYISEDEALEIAADYWDFERGDRDPDTGFLFTIMLFDTPTAEAPQYKAVLQWLVDEDTSCAHWSTVDWIWIDAVTGAISTESKY